MDSYRRSGWLFLGVVLLMLSANAALFLINEADILRLYAYNGLLVSIAAIYIPAVLFMRGNDEHSHGRIGINFRQVLLSLALGWGIFLLNAVISLASSMLTEWLGMKSLTLGMPEMGGWRTLAAVFLLCILPAITEETLFRGVLLNEWKLLGKRKAVALTSVLFALIHFQPDAIPSVLLIGIILALTAWHTGSVYPAMIVHFTNNFAVLWLSAADMGSAQPEITTNETVFALILYLITGAAVTYISYKRLKATAAEKSHAADLTEPGSLKQKRITLPLSISIIMLLALNAFAAYMMFGGTL